MLFRSLVEGWTERSNRGAQKLTVMTCSRRGLHLAIALPTLLLAGCDRMGMGFTKIADILANPQRYAEREIRIQGKVVNVLKIPFVATKLYSVQDGSGEINVRTGRDVPLAGAEVRVKGVLDAVAVIGDQNVGVHLREIEAVVRRRMAPHCNRGALCLLGIFRSPDGGWICAQEAASVLRHWQVLESAEKPL